jgi:hypothetical protein
MVTTAGRVADRQRGVRLAEVAEEQPGTAAGPEQRQQLVTSMLELVDGLYSHLPLKQARYGGDPIQRLRLLRDRCQEMTDSAVDAELSAVVASLHDAHTTFQGGQHAGQVAVLPFLVEGYGPPGERRFIVSKTGPAELIGDDQFVPGVELLAWSGVPFERAVQRWAESQAGGRPDAREARAVESLTMRSLEHVPMPDEQWVLVSYQPAESDPREVRIPWRVVTPGQARQTVDSTADEDSLEGRVTRAAAAIAQDPAAEAVRRAKQLLFAPSAWAASTKGAIPPPRRRTRPPTRGSALESRLPDLLAARIRPTSLGDIGHLRIWSFAARDDEAFLTELERLLDALPDRGLIVDLRGNPGGLIWAAERALQLFTPRRIDPVRFSLRATDLTRALATAPGDPLGVAAWGPSLRDAVSTGELYSQPLPMTDPEACNDRGQRYGGPVLCVVDATTYSAGDLFAAGFADNGIGDLVCVGEATGAGGANAWPDTLIRTALARTTHALAPLPDSVHFTLSVRRATRTGPSSGTPIEDLGIAGVSHWLTRDDLVGDNGDLIEWCAQRLAAVPQSSLHAARQAQTLVVRTSGLDRLDLYEAHHPWKSVPISSGEHRFGVAKRPGAITVEGWLGETLLQRRQLPAVEE